MNHFINTSLNHMVFRSRLVSRPKIKSISSCEYLFNATDLLPITLGVILPSTLRGKNSINSQNDPGTLHENKTSNVHTIKILLDSDASASTIRNNILYE